MTTATKQATKRKPGLEISEETLGLLKTQFCVCGILSLIWQYHDSGCPFRNIAKGSSVKPDEVDGEGRKVHQWSRSNPYPR